MLTPSTPPIFNPEQYRVTLGEACAPRNNILWLFLGAAGMWLLPPLILGVGEGARLAVEDSRKAKRSRRGR